VFCLYFTNNMELAKASNSSRDETHIPIRFILLLP